MPAFPADVSVAIVAHNAEATLPAAIESLRRAGCPLARITVVDVASTDGTVASLAREYPEIRLRRLPDNRGPSPGRNVAIREASTPYVLLMDADVTVEEDTVVQLRGAMAAEGGVGIASPVVVHADRPEIIQYAGTALHFICEAINPWLDRPLAERGTDPCDLGVASTCALLVARDVALHVGLFDERYFIGKEDGDFTHRVRLAGYRIVEVPTARVRHRSRPRSPWLFYYQIRNRWHFMLKNYQWRTLVAILPVLAVHELLQGAVLVGKGHGWTYLKAIVGVLRLLPALPADRALVARIRVLPDTAVLCAGPIVARADLVGGPRLARAKAAYETLLAAYWRLVRRLLTR
jgi:GT2 family glycosyltransferase